MKKSLIVLPLILAVAVPARATGGMTCKTAGPKPVEAYLVIGHVAGSPLVSGRMTDAGRAVEVRAAQWWFDASELRLRFVDPQATRSELTIEARRNGRYYDGALQRSGVSRWVRCRES
jgi:hypothetical protein